MLTLVALSFCDLSILNVGFVVTSCFVVIYWPYSFFNTDLSFEDHNFFCNTFD